MLPLPAVWHPAVVHFPIVLLALGGPAALVWAVRGSSFWRGVTLWLLVLGTAGAYVARETGEDLEHQVEGEPRVDKYLHQHEEASDWAFYLGIATVLTVGGATGLSVWMGRRERTMAAETIFTTRLPGAGSGAVRAALALRIVGAILALATTAAVVRTAHFGGLMTWGERPAEAPSAPPASTP